MMDVTTRLLLSTLVARFLDDVPRSRTSCVSALSCWSSCMQPCRRCTDELAKAGKWTGDVENLTNAAIEAFKLQFAPHGVR